jgi:cob(I)alamin adenosyltransferase
MAEFYTRSGDDGYTGLLGEGRAAKYDPRLEAVGALDEANAALGLARAFCQVEQNRTGLLTTQRDLYGLMAEVAADPLHAARFRKIDPSRLDWLEAQIEKLSQSISLPSEFIVPGDAPASAALDLARTLVRRAERQVAFLLHQGAVENPVLLQYLNRLSSYCFALELSENQAGGISSPTLAKNG